jgi:uncharacterized protein involved in cysteine biosynthesis
MIRAIQLFFSGASMPFRAVRVLLDVPKLALFSLFPMLLTLLLYFVMYQYVFLPGVDSASDNIASFLRAIPLFGSQSWLVDGLHYLAMLILRFSYWIVAALLFSFCSNVLGVVFYDQLAALTEPHTNPGLAKLPPTTWAEEGLKLWRDFLKSVLAALLMLLCLILAIIPFFAVFSVLGIWLLMAFQYLTYPQTRRCLATRACLGSIFKNFWVCLGFGASATLGLSIPLFAAVWTPLLVVGGTLLFAQLKRSA